jgi:hypothetical protein
MSDSLRDLLATGWLLLFIGTFLYNAWPLFQF